MASIDQPQGFRPYGSVKESFKFTAGSRVFPGDCVILAADGKIDPAAATNDILGVALGYADVDGDPCLVSVDPEQVYIAQDAASDLDAQADVGQTADILATAGNTTYNASRMELDGTSIGASQDFVLLGIYEASGQQAFVAADSNHDVLCKINSHQIFGENDFTSI